LVSYLLDQLKQYRNDIAHNRTFYPAERDEFITLSRRLIRRLIIAARAANMVTDIEQTV
jgi:hypothetical protein